jgi:predicted permease
MNTVLQDVRYALRQLRRSPGFTITVILTLALGIGANAAIFTLFDQVLLRMLPVQKPQELVRFDWTGSFHGMGSSFGGDITNYFSYPMYKDLRDKNQVFSGVVAAIRTGVGVSWHNQAQNEDAEMVSGNYFQVLGVRPVMGRLLAPQDDAQKNSNPVAVLSYNFWNRRFAMARDIVGQTILVNGHSFTVIGVAAPGFDSAIGGYRPALFVPISMDEAVIPWRIPADDFNNRRSVWLTLAARLKPGVTAAQAEASMQPLWHSLRQEEFSQLKDSTPDYHDKYVEKSQLKVVSDAQGFFPERTDLKKPLIILMSMSGLLVLMCAINVATLLLLRAAARTREMSMRYALGAKRSRILGQLVLEGGMLGLLGAGAGLALAPPIATLLVHLVTNANPGSEPYSSAIDVRVLAFTIALSAIVALLFSIAPAIHYIRPDLANSLRQNAGTASVASQRFRKAAVGAQIALSVMLLGGAGLFVRTLDHLRSQSIGFDVEHLITFNLDPSSSGYGESQTPQIMTNALSALSAIPGVTSVGASNDPVLSGNQSRTTFDVQGYKPAPGENTNLEYARITPGYFATLRQPLLDGREFTLADARNAPRVVVINLAAAKKYYGSAEKALGRQLSERDDGNKVYLTIVGVVGDINHSDLRTKLGPAAWSPFAQSTHPAGMTIYLRTAQKPELIEPAVRRVMQQLDSTLVVDGLRTMDEQVNRIASDERALAYLAVGFSGLAMLLSAVGLYGVLAYSTEQRTREIGVRLALGATRSNVVGLVLREMVYIALTAVIIAIPSTIALARLFRSQLYGVTSADPVTMTAAVLLTAVMVFLAAALPSFRAAGVQPVRALREE